MMSGEATRAERCREIVARMYSCALTGDPGAVAELFADDITVKEADNHPFPGTWTGKAEVLDVLPTILGGLRMTAIEVLELMGNTNRVAALLKVGFIDKDGEAFSQEVLELSTVDDQDKICEVRPFYDDLVELRARLGFN